MKYGNVVLALFLATRSTCSFLFAVQLRREQCKYRSMTECELSVISMIENCVRADHILLQLALYSAVRKCSPSVLYCCLVMRPEL